MYSVVEYCSPVWARIAYCHKVDTEIKRTIRIITGSVRSTEVQWLPTLANITPPDLRTLQYTKRIIKKITKKYSELPLHDNFTKHPPKRLKSRQPTWDLETTKDTMMEFWKKRWKNSGVRNASLIDNPKLRVSGFELPRMPCTTLNRARMEQGKCKYLMRNVESQNPRSVNAEYIKRYVISSIYVHKHILMEVWRNYIMQMRVQ